MMTSKQRAKLRAMANGTETILHIGKDGINENLVRQADDALKKRELIKARVLESAMLSATEAAQAIAEKTGSETVQVIGSRFVLYRKNEKLGEKSIAL